MNEPRTQMILLPVGDVLVPIWVPEGESGGPGPGCLAAVVAALAGLAIGLALVLL